MADFKIAMSWLRQGKKIARPCWDRGSYWRIIGDNTERIVWSDGEKAGVHLKQIEARDWQIYGENSDLSYKSKCGNCGKVHKIGPNNFRQFIKELKAARFCGKISDEKIDALVGPELK